MGGVGGADSGDWDDGYGGGCGGPGNDYGIGGSPDSGTGTGGVGGTTPGTGGGGAECVTTPSEDPNCEYGSCLCDSCISRECSSALRDCADAGDPGCEAECVTGSEPVCYFLDCRNWMCGTYCVEAGYSGGNRN